MGYGCLTCLKGRSERTRMLAREAQIEDLPTYEDLVAETDMILSILVPESALDMARLVAGALRNAQQTTIFVDCNAVSPGTVKAVAEVITAAGSRCIDAGIIGPPPTRPGVTRFYASGPEVERFTRAGQLSVWISGHWERRSASPLRSRCAMQRSPKARPRSPRSSW